MSLTVDGLAVADGVRGRTVAHQASEGTAAAPPLVIDGFCVRNSSGRGVEQYGIYRALEQDVPGGFPRERTAYANGNPVTYTGIAQPVSGRLDEALTPASARPKEEAPPAMQLAPPRPVRPVPAAAPAVSE